MNLNNQFKSLSYYCPQLVETYKVSICAALKNMKLEASKHTELTITDEIEKKLKAKYNLLIPAIFIEVIAGKSDIVLEKEDLSKVNRTNLSFSAHLVLSNI
jgi:hypothetical protein